MTACCQTKVSHEGTNSFFSRWSKSYAKRFRKGKLEKVQRYLLDGVRSEGISSGEILDIGCGVGSLHLTLLKEGAARATGVDIAEGMLEQAKQFSEQLGLTEKTRYIQGDFVEKSDEVQEADVAMLDKVVCCYENVEELVKRSTRKTRRLYGLSHPRQSLLMKSMFKTHIFVSKLFRSKFVPFWHDWSWVRGLIVAQGFQLVYENATIAWQVAVYKRV